ncbi:MAG TPA: LEA type 2 family protein [Gemmatimonadales bacterium]
MPDRRTRIRLLTALALCLLPACTPLGLWIYEEPRIEITEVRVDDAADNAYPVRVSFRVSNENDFGISLDRVQLLLVLNDTPVIDRELSTTASFAARDQQIVEIGVAWTDIGPGLRPRSLAPGAPRYSVSGHAFVQTPIGERRIPFARAGTGAAPG